MTLLKKVKATKAAMKAGLIAGRCNLCVIDDEAEEIRPCPKHEAEIMRLSKISLENW